MSFRILDSYGRAPNDENEFVCSIRGWPCLHFLPLTPAYSAQILLRRVSDSFALQEANSYDSPLQRVSIRLPFPLPAASLARNFEGDLELLTVQSVFCHLRNVSLVRFLGLCSTFVLASTSQHRTSPSDKFLQGLHLLLSSV